MSGLAPTGSRIRGCQQPGCREDRAYVVTWIVGRGVLSQRQVCAAHLDTLLVEVNAKHLPVVDVAPMT